MKYFTPELHVRLQGLDAREMDQADAEWERAEQKYRRRLKAIRAKLPQSALDVLEGVPLHDAEVLWIGHARSSLRIL
ncbi:MAG TPA: hypothetical protein VGX78_06605, partial [Pirellulales bacterium]|nr:hypothetical protein [Pirellulales bacterium]